MQNVLNLKAEIEDLKAGVLIWRTVAFVTGAAAGFLIAVLGLAAALKWM